MSPEHLVALYVCECVCRQLSVEPSVTHRRRRAYLEGAVYFCYFTR